MSLCRGGAALGRGFEPDDLAGRPNSRKLARRASRRSFLAAVALRQTDDDILVALARTTRGR